MNLKGKTIVLGVTGSIAAYKAAELASQLTKAGARVEVIMTDAATEFVTAVTFWNITGRPWKLFKKPARNPTWPDISSIAGWPAVPWEISAKGWNITKKP